MHSTKVKKLKKYSTSLKITHPTLSTEWHPTKNGDLTPNDVTAGSGKKVYWKCSKGVDHIWEAEIKNRAGKGRGCPICSGYKVVASNSLATNNPELAKEWHPIKNAELEPISIYFGSHKKVWWKCAVNPLHEWQATVMHRNRLKTGCPYCSGKKISDLNRLSIVVPEALEIWHPTKNQKKTPHDVSFGSSMNAWWTCDKDESHVYQQVINSKFNGGKVRLGCPFCSGAKINHSNCLTTTHPEFVDKWHPTKNGDLTPNDVTSGSNIAVWWKCAKGEDHIWKVKINAMIDSTGCPFCIGSKIGLENSFPKTEPLLFKEWFNEKNKDVDPYSLGRTSQKKVWWKCPKGEDHIWKASINNRTNKKNSRGCPICSGHKVVRSNCLANLKPKLAKEWYQPKNGDLTPFDVTAGSGKKVWWKCDKGVDHIWQTKISHRANKDIKSECPFCTLTPQSKQELTITFELKQFFNINPKGFKTRVNGKLWSIDIYIPEINLGIEFDGAYWHKGKRELDKLKTEQLHHEGFHIIRVRQEPLKRIFDTDVMASKDFNGKLITNEILNQILKDHTLDSKSISKISKYLVLDSLQNEQALDKYIDMILEEKAERNLKRTTTKPKLH